MASKYAIDPKNPYAGLTGLAEKTSKATKEAADYGYLASVLPSVLKEKFREAGDPKLDAAISTKTQQVMGGAIEGLNKYQDISNPFTRRALAEKYQSGLSIGLDSLTSEKERRQGKFEEYINKWSGLYGAEAARKQSQATLAQGEFNTYKSLADTIESNRRYEEDKAESARRWNIEQANKGTTKEDEGLFREYLADELARSAGKDGKFDPVKYRQLRDEAYAKGISKETFDSQFGTGLGEHEYKGAGIQLSASRTPKQQYEDELYSSIKPSRDQAADGELYKKDGRVFRKKSGWFGGNNDEEVEL